MAKARADIPCQCPLCRSPDALSGDSASGLAYTNCNACRSQVFARGPESHARIVSLRVVKPTKEPPNVEAQPVHEETTPNATTGNPAHEQPVARRSRYFRAA